MTTTIFFCVTYLAAFAAVMRYDIQMFQQNGYVPSRYLRWLGKSFLAHRRLIVLVAPFLCWTPLLRTVAAIDFLYLAWKEFSTSYKIKIVYTRRVVRLIISCVLLSGLAVFAVFKAGGEPVHACAAAALVLTFSPFVILLANFVNAPLEAAVRRWYYNDARRILASRPDLIIIGITGSFGKTSTKNYLYRILSEKYNTLVTPGNFNTTLGVVRTVRENLKPYHKVFIVEMGARQKGDIKAICDLVHPTIGIVTSVGDMHLETFKTRENILSTKFELLHALPPEGTGIINLDSEAIAGAAIPSHCRMISYGIHNKKADCIAGDITYSRTGTAFRLKGIQSTTLELQTRLLAESNVLDITAAVIAGQCLGVEEESIRMAVSKLQTVEHRLSVSSRGGLVVLDDAYNSNPVGARMALDVMNSMAVPEGGHHIIITPGFVEMGERQFEANRELGAYAAKKADILVIVNRLNREAILSGAKEEGMDGDRIICADSLSEAVRLVGPLTCPGDVVLYENDLPDLFK